MEKETIKQRMTSHIANSVEKAAEVYAASTCMARFYEPEVPAALREKE